MKIAVTGGTGFIGRYIIRRLVSVGHSTRCWYRSESDRGGFNDLSEEQRGRIEWIEGDLNNLDSQAPLVGDCDVVVHGALARPGTGFMGAEGDVVQFVETNVLGTIRLVESALRANVPRFIYLSTCAVHDEIMDDRPLDEAHPLWPRTHYGAHKAAVEKFIHSYGLGQGYTICSLRPCGVYGVRRPVENSKWYPLIQSVVSGETVDCKRGGKEVHAADVAAAVEILLTAEGISGQAYSCFDRYVSEFEVATLAKQISGSSATINGQPKSPKHMIVTDKLQALGMKFGGEERLNETISQLVAAVS